MIIETWSKEDELRAALDDATARAEAAERERDDLLVMLSCLDEYISYRNNADGPPLSLAEWWAIQPNEIEVQP